MKTLFIILLIHKLRNRLHYKNLTLEKLDDKIY